MCELESESRRLLKILLTFGGVGFESSEGRNVLGVEGEGEGWEDHIHKQHTR